MAELVFARSGEVLFRAALNTRLFRVGQSPLNDLMLPHDGVAPFQASLERSPDGFQVVDRSGKGVLLNGKSVEKARLKDGDVLAFGALEAAFHQGVSDSQTGVLPTDAPAKGQVYLESKDGRRHAVSEAGLKVGKDVSNDVVIPDSFTSSFHALVFRRAGATVVKDLGSTNGTFVQDIKVTEAEAPEGSHIAFGRVTYVVKTLGKTAAAAMPASRQTVGELVFMDPAMQQVAQQMRSVAAHDAPVAITGESGVGKELVARAIHQLSARAALPFVAVNCAALSPNLVESELFGHEKGAFTGAERTRMGAFEEAGHGTLFLDEVGDLPADAQAKLLRALENKEIRRVGGDGVRKIHCRVLTATHQDLAARVADGKFRNDLFHRLTVLPVRVPALRERRQDIELLARHFLADMGGGKVQPTEAALQKLADHPWPGNVRELRNVLLQSVVFSGKTRLDAEDIKFAPMPLSERVEEGRVYSPGKTMMDIECDAIEQAVHVLGSHSAAARELGISRSTVITRMQQRKKKTT